MNGYICFFERKRIELHAESRSEAIEQAMAIFKPSKKNKHMVSVCLAEIDDVPVVHSTIQL